MVPATWCWVKALKMLKLIEVPCRRCLSASPRHSIHTPAAKWYGVAKDFRFKIQRPGDQPGSEFIVAIAGEMIRACPVPADPQAARIDIVNGEISEVELIITAAVSPRIQWPAIRPIRSLAIRRR